MGRWISPDSINYLDPESINGLNLYVYCGNNPVMYSDPEGTFVITFGMALLIGTVTGFVIGGGISAVTQAYENDWNWSEVNLGKVLLDATVGAISGAVAVTGIGVWGSVAFGGAISGASSIFEDLVINQESVNWNKFWLSVGIGMIGGRISGPGIDAKNLIGKYMTNAARLASNMGPRKIAMYAAKQAVIRRTIVISTIRFSASIVSSSIASSRLSYWLDI